MSSKSETSALVIGGSMAGLLAARVLSNHFGSVTLIERDLMHDKPESRKGQPQTRHVHGLLVQGLNVLVDYFPDIIEALKSSGNPVRDMAESMQWYCYGGYRTRFTFGIQGISTSRPFLEWQVRRRVLALPNVKVMDGYSVEKLLTSENKKQITGVQVTRQDSKEQSKALLADLVVDASGRGSRSPKWLAELGYSKPVESVVTCGAAYATRLYGRNPEEPGSQDWIFITPEAPKERRLGVALPIEENKWMVALCGWHGDHAPSDEAGFIAFAKSLPAPDVYNIISRSTPLSDIVVNKFPSNLRRHYEKLSDFPEGYLVLGDAMCSFNPLYGQGMTTAALQASVLDKILSKQSIPDKIAKLYFKQVAKIIEMPWQMAVGEDFRFPETKGKKAMGTELINSYVAKVHRATHHDAVVGDAFLKVMNMMEPPTSLFHPRILWRVFRSTLQKRPSALNKPLTPARMASAS